MAERVQSSDLVIKTILNSLYLFFDELLIVYVREDPIFSNQHLNFYVNGLEYNVLFKTFPGEKSVEIKLGEWFGRMNVLYCGVLFIPCKVNSMDDKIKRIKEIINSLLNA